MNILNYIGNTPLIKLNIDDKNIADIYLKLEYFNPGGSIKTRVAAKMIECAEKEGKLQYGDTIIEATGGNTGIGLAIVANIKKYNFTAVVPDNYSIERIKILRKYGANVILSKSEQGNDSHIVLVKDMIAKNNSYVWLNQFENIASIKAHYEGTGKEIASKIIPDAFVASVGSAGTFQGIGEFLKSINPEILLAVAQPKGCSLKQGKAISHKIQGISLGIVPPLLNYNLIDEYIDVGYNDTIKMMDFLIKNDGLFVGLSSAQNVMAAYIIAKKLGHGKKVCTVAPDSGTNYLNDILYKEESL